MGGVFSYRPVTFYDMPMLPCDIFTDFVVDFSLCPLCLYFACFALFTSTIAGCYTGSQHVFPHV